jgi:hypothetical protein
MRTSAEERSCSRLSAIPFTPVKMFAVPLAFLVIALYAAAAW